MRQQRKPTLETLIEVEDLIWGNLILREMKHTHTLLQIIDAAKRRQFATATKQAEQAAAAGGK